MKEVIHIGFSYTSTIGGRGNFNTTYCGLDNYWGSGNPEHVPTDPQLLFGSWDEATCPDCILTKLGEVGD